MSSTPRLRRLSGSLALCSFFAGQSAYAAEYYLAPTGDDANDGSMAKPFATMQKGADLTEAGDTAWIRGGTYSIGTPKNSGASVSFTKSGTSDQKRIKYWAYQGEKPVFDFTNMTLSTTGYTHGFAVNASAGKSGNATGGAASGGSPASSAGGSSSTAGSANASGQGLGTAGSGVAASGSRRPPPRAARARPAPTKARAAAAKCHAVAVATLVMARFSRCWPRSASPRDGAGAACTTATS